MELERRFGEIQASIARLGAERQIPLWDWSRVGRKPELRTDSIHLSAAGYRQAAMALSAALQSADPAAVERLRQAIIRKNQWFFHQSRPANMAYVFGFRSHEQGQNAEEIPRYDEILAAEQQRITQLASLPADPPAPPAEVTRSRAAEFTPQPTPEFIIDDDWEVTLWAENPMLNKPIQMNFDAAGNLYVASSVAYPMIEVGQTPDDRILVLADRDGDGRADHSREFAGGLLIPTGVLPAISPGGNPGVYVAQSTDLLWIEDTDGDGVGDSTTRVLSGFGTEDTHHNLHTLTRLPDGRIAMAQSVYTRTNTETPAGVVRMDAGGGFALDPVSERLSVLFRGLWNPWGHAVDADRQLVSDRWGGI